MMDMGIVSLDGSENKQSSQMWWLDVEDDRFWRTLLIIGILLNIIVIYVMEVDLI